MQKIWMCFERKDQTDADVEMPLKEMCSSLGDPQENGNLHATEMHRSNVSASQKSKYEQDIRIS